MGAAARAVTGLLEDVRNRGLGAVDCTASTSRYNHGSDGSLDDRDAQSWLLLLRPVTINNANKRVVWKNSGTQGVQMQQGPFGGTQGRFNYTRSRATTNTTVTAPNDTLVADRYQWVGITDQDGVAPEILHALLGRWLEPLASYATQTTGVGAPLTEASLNLFVGSRDSANTESDCHIAAIWGYRRRLTKREFWLHQLAPWCNLGDDCFLHVLYGLGPGRAIDWSGRGNHGTPEGTPPPLRRGPDILAPGRRRLFPGLGLTPVAQSFLLAYEALSGLQATAALPFEALGSLETSSPLPFEALQGLEGVQLVPYEVAGAVSVAVLLSYEALAQLTSVGALPLEVLQGIERGEVVLFEALGGVALATPLPYEAEGTAAAPARTPFRVLVVGGSALAAQATRGVRVGSVTPGAQVEVY